MALEEDDLKWRGDGETNMSKVLSMQLMLGASDFVSSWGCKSITVSSCIELGN